MTKATILLRKLFELQFLVPILCFVILLGVKTTSETGLLITILSASILGVSVMSSVHHAEVIAHKIGEGLGTLVLALSVTIIEVGLILSVMGNNGPGADVLARDTVFAAVMIVTNGILALCLILGGLRFKEQDFQVQGSNSLLAVLIALSFLVFVLPNFTTSTAGASYNNLQMAFIGSILFLLYLLFIFFQTKTHKSYFEPTLDSIDNGESSHHEDVSVTDAWLSFVSLCISLIVVIGLAKFLSPAIEKGVAVLGAPKSVVGLLIALIVLLPESWAAVNSARANRLQISLNLALGSGIASIALTIPVVIGYSLLTNTPLTLGLDPKNLTFMVMTFAVGTITLGTGKSTLLQGAIHGVILLTYFVLSFVP